MGITHIINCAGDVCKDYFADQFIYRTYYLKDSKTEVFQLILLSKNIECTFYECIFLMEDALK